MIAVIGCGYWGKNLIRNFSELGVLSAVCDRDDQLPKQFATQYHVRSLTFEEILIDPTITAVVIAAAPSLNGAFSLKALAAGKHVFVEKPHAFTQEMAEQLDLCLVQSLKENPHQVFMVGHLLLYHAAFLKVKELLGAGTIGELHEIRCFRHGLGRLRADYNVLWELAPHDLSMLLNLNPYPIDNIQVIASDSLTGRPDTVRALYAFSNGVLAHLSCSWAEPVKQQQLILQGSHGYIIFDDTKSWLEKVHLVQFESPMSLEAINNNQYTVKSISVDPEEVLKRECAHFLDCIQNQKTPLSDINQARQVFDVLMRTQMILEDEEK